MPRFDQRRRGLRRRLPAGELSNPVEALRVRALARRGLLRANDPLVIAAGTLLDRLRVERDAERANETVSVVGGMTR